VRSPRQTAWFQAWECLKSGLKINVAKNPRQYIMRRMKIGYARVSTDDQTLDLQLDALAQAGCELIYQEHASGKNTGRQELDACLKALRSGDCLAVWRLDRLGRNLGDLVRIVNELEARSVGFESVMEHIETTSPSGKLVFHLFAALAEFERNVTRERTLAGLRSARARGRKGGRPKKLTGKEDLDMLRALVKGGVTPVKDIAVRFGVSRATVYRLAPTNGKP
jgi:DNA invertase Pin-like site-specific DNA recombinase